MKIKEYLKNNGIKATWFHKQIPCSTAHFFNIVHEICLPSTVIRKRIETLTNRQVTEKDFEINE